MSVRLEDSAAARVSVADIRAALETLTAVASPRGGEYALAMRLAQWARTRWPQLHWAVDCSGTGGASLISRSSRDAEDSRLIYSHLDTSLTGDLAWDQNLTGRIDAPARFEWDEANDVARGFGLGVAKGPAAAALVGYAAAATQRLEHCGEGGPGLALLLAGSGTHRSPFETSATGRRSRLTGVERYLGTGRRPDDVVVAKCGPPGPLHHEPGALFIKVRLDAELLPAMAASSATPVGGLPLQLAPLLSGLAAWRDSHLARRAPCGQIAPEIGVGSIVAGRPGKPDLLPAAVEVHAYVVLIDGDDADQIGADVRQHVVDAVARTALAGCRLDVQVAQEHSAASTPASASIVRRAEQAWAIERGAPPEQISGWKGSTDGVVFRSAGCRTVRLGPSPTTTASDRRLDQLSISDLTTFARIYARLGA